jgi:hypothetical protein
MTTAWTPGGLINREEFLRRLTDRFPGVAAGIDDIDQGLLHLEMSAFARVTADAIDGRDRAQAMKFLEFAEEILAAADAAVENAIHVSYLENIFLGDEPLRVEARAWLPPRLAKGLVELEQHFERLSQASARDKASARRFSLPTSAIRPLTTGRGSCIASDLITVEGRPVCYMYREQPDDSTDSGWRFFSGDETQEYADDASNFAMYDVNTIANYDRDIIEFLDSPPGSAFGRERGGAFKREPTPEDT